MSTRQLWLDVFELTVDSDPDFDGLPGGCDDDSDNDGFADNNDNCPYVSNGDSAPIFFPDHDGYIRSWLWRGPYQVPGESCLPQGVNLVGNEATIAPSTGDGLNTPFWETHHDNANYVDLNADMGGARPREAYLFAYLIFEEAQSLKLMTGSDDGLRITFNGIPIFEHNGCRGLTLDDDENEVNVLAGLNRLMLHVRDTGGGWSAGARFLDLNDVPFTNYKVRLQPDDVGVGQTDTDGDNIGDACDSDNDFGD